MKMELSSAKAVPITILTGFLGAGKTTLLNRILSGDHGLRVAVLVNDFGAINIDAELVIGVKNDVISLTNGCVCCSIRDDLVATVLETIDRPEAPEYILLEASGVADPSGITMTFSDSGLRDRIRLDSVTCVIDADQVFAHPKYPAVEQLQLRQIGFSDLLILNKVDLAGVEKVTKVGEWIDDHFNKVRIVETNFCEVPLEILLSAGRFDSVRTGLDGYVRMHVECDDPDCRDERHDHGRGREHKPNHSNVFGTWCYETDRQLSLEALREAARKLPGNIYRCKGVIYSSDAPDRPLVLQVVGRRVDISMQEGWGQRAPRTQIVAIGAAGGIDAKLLEETFASCISAPTADMIA
jgi:G3E family GTPase